MSVRDGALRQRILAGAMLCFAMVVPAAARAQEPAAAREHVVRRGDTLWDLASQFLGTPWAWPRLFEANRGVVKDPHWIYPGEKLIIPGREAAAPAAEPQPAEAAEPAEPERTRFYRPQAAADSNATAGETGPALRPVVDRAEYLGAPWLAPLAGLKPVGWMLDRVKAEGNAERLPQASVIYSRIYIRPEGGAQAPGAGTELLLVRVDRELPPYGSVVEPTAVLRVESGDAGVAIARIVRQYGPVWPGQRALALPAFTPPAAQPSQPVERGPAGELVGFVQEQPLHTIADLAFVSIGGAEGLRVGDELVAYAPTRSAATDPAVRVPPEDVARLLVVKVSEHTATARPLSLRLPSLQRGLLVRLVARVP